MYKNIKTFRKGAKVRYIGNNKRMIEEWGNSIQTVLHKRGDSVVGYFPFKYYDGEIRTCRYSVPIRELELVIKED